jgi:PGF-CTERM protein
MKELSVVSMIEARRSVFMTTVVLISALAGGMAFSGPAAALSADTAAPYPHSPGTSVDEFPVSVVAQRGDAITRGGMKSMTLNFGADSGFDGSVQNVSSDSVSVSIVRQNNQSTISPSNVSTNRNGQVKITFRQPVPVRAGNRIVVDVSNMTTPSSEGVYEVRVSATTPAGTTDGPVSVDYRVAGADLTFPNQSASQFSGNQTVTVSGVVPNAGYIGVFTVAENGSRGRLVGSTQTIIASYNSRNYTVNLTGTVEESQQLRAVAYYETSGGSQSERLNGTFDPNEDAVVTNNSVPATATGFVTTLGADARLKSGTEYDQGARLYFSQGEPNTAYQVQTVKNGEIGSTVTQFETASNGTATINTTGLDEGRYTVTRIDDGSVVDLDNDSTTSPQDDSFFITGQMFTEATAIATNTAAASTDGTPTDAGSSSGTNDSGGASGNGSGDGSAGSGAFGPGFGIVVAAIALLGAALLVTRRDQ